MATATIAKEDREQLWKEYKADPTQKELRNRLVETYLPLVRYNGERIWARLPDGVELDDLISAMTDGGEDPDGDATNDCAPAPARKRT